MIKRISPTTDGNFVDGVEQTREKKVRKQFREQWLKQNQSAIESYNVDVELHGVFSDGLRFF